MSESKLKSESSELDRLAYLELISTSIVGLQNAILSLVSRRSFSGLDETREIDIKISELTAAREKVKAARNLYLAEDVRFKAPSRDDVEKAKAQVDRLDSIIVANEKATSIIESATALISAFTETQG